MATRLLTSRLRHQLTTHLHHHHLHLHLTNPIPLPPLQKPLPYLLSPHHFFSTIHRPFQNPLPLLNNPHRFFSTVRRNPTTSRSRTADIGARARQIQSRRLWIYALTLGCSAGFVVIILANFQDQLVFYLTPTDALERFNADPSRSHLRLGGLVLEGSVSHPSPDSPEMEFVVTDLLTDILVKYEGSVPDLFREGHSVVVEGDLKRFADLKEEMVFGKTKVSEKARQGECFLKATDVLAKHDEKYMPKEVAEALEKNRKILQAQAEAAAAGEAPAAVVAGGAENCARD